MSRIDIIFVIHPRSRSGCSGAGWLKGLGTLLPLGAYRVDTRYNEFQRFVSLGKAQRAWHTEDVQVLVPYVSHEEEKEETLRKYPTILRVDDNKVIFCNFEDNFMEILKAIFSGETLPEECQINGATYTRRGHRTLKRTFTELTHWGETREEEISIEFYNLCSMDETPDPWEFFQEDLKRFLVGSYERMFHLLSVEKVGDDFVQTINIAGGRYRGRILSGDPLETGELTAGWQRLDDNSLVRFYDGSNEAHLVAYLPTKAAYEKLARRYARHMNEGEEFISFVSDCGRKYVEFELVVPKVLYLLDQSAQLAELRKGLMQKMRDDVRSRVQQWIDSIDDRELLEAVPDDLVITFEDSLAAGNCRPGTEAFVKENFPGQTQTTAKELKKFSNNYDVMRIFRHLAATGRFDWKSLSDLSLDNPW